MKKLIYTTVLLLSSFVLISQNLVKRPLYVIDSRSTAINRNLPANSLVYVVDDREFVNTSTALTNGALLNSVTLNTGRAEAENFRGYYTSVLALTTAVPTGNNGDFAIVNPTGNQNIAIYLWEGDNDIPQWITVASSGTVPTGITPGGRVDLSSHSVTELNDVSNAGSGQIITTAERTSFTTHVASTSNPHSVTLEQARTAGSILSGNIAMASNKITGLATPTDASDAANKAYVDNVITNIDWKESVLDVNLDDPPGLPATGDRYLVSIGSNAATGDWLGNDNSFAVYDGESWVFTLPELGDVVVDEEAINTDEKAYVYNGTAWVRFTGGATTHNTLNGLQGGTTDEYYHLTQAEHTTIQSLSTVATSGSYNDLSDLPTIPNTEAIQDAVGEMVQGNTETGITVTYDDVNNKLNFVVNTAFQAPSISGFNIQGQSTTVDDGTTLSGSQTFNYVVSNPSNVQGNLVLSQGATPISSSVDPNQTSVTETIISVTLANSGDQVVWTLSGTDLSGNSFSATFTVTALADHEFFYILESTVNDPVNVDITGSDGQDDKIEITTSGQTGTFTVGPTVAGEFIILLAPADHDLTSLVNTGINQDVRNLYTRTVNVRQINAVNYNSYVFGPVNAGITITYRYTLN